MQSIYRALSMIGLFTLLSDQIAGRDICILEPLTVAEVQGRVVSAKSEQRPEESLPGATVELSQLSDKYGWRVVIKTTTDANGYFSLTHIRPGNYTLSAKYTGLFTTAVGVRVNKPRNGQKGEEEIILALGAAVKGCHGGYAEIRTRKRK